MRPFSIVSFSSAPSSSPCSCSLELLHHQMEISSYYLLVGTCLDIVNTKEKYVLHLLVYFDKWVEYRREEKSRAKFRHVYSISLLQLTDEQFAFIPLHLHNRH